MIEQMEEASRSSNLGLWLHLDLEFHGRCYAPCQSPRLLKLIASFWQSTHHYRRAYCMLPGQIGRAEATRRRMLTALEARDGEQFGRLTREHIQESLRSILEVQPRGFARLGDKLISQ